MVTMITLNVITSIDYHHDRDHHRHYDYYNHHDYYYITTMITDTMNNSYDFDYNYYVYYNYYSNYDHDYYYHYYCCCCCPQVDELVGIHHALRQLRLRNREELDCLELPVVPPAAVAHHVPDEAVLVAHAEVVLRAMLHLLSIYVCFVLFSVTS